MKAMYPSVGVAKLCGLFGKTRQAFYDHCWRNSSEQLQQALVVELVTKVREQLPRIGGLKLFYMLKNDFLSHNIAMGRDSFFKLLREYNLLVKRKRHYVRTTDSNHMFRKWPDLTRNLKIKSAQQLWVSDITYLRTENGFIYLSLITDAFSRKIVGYHLSQHLKVQGCLVALKKAILSLSNPDGLIHHSDRGIQYCCEPYVAVLQSHGIRISMTQSGSPYENAIAERVNGILKIELQLDKTFSSYSTAVPEVHKAIDLYNRLRPHMSCNYQTPGQVHMQATPQKKMTKMTGTVKPAP